LKYFESAISTPIVSSATFAYENSQEGEDIFAGKSPKPLYARMGNPTSSILEEKLSQMEGGVGAIATSSGMGAITMSIMSMCSSGDEIISIGGLFGGSYALMSQTLPRFGITTHFLSCDEVGLIESKITKNTKVIFCESIGNPSLRVPNLQAIGEIASKYGIAFIVDNTISPIMVQPFEYGADIVIYSTTKIISGNSSALGGVSIYKKVEKDDKFHTKRYQFLEPFIKKLQEKALIGCAKKRALRDFGMSANAHSSYQTLLGLETLPLRLQQIKNSCEVVALCLEENGMKVNHPSLAKHPENKLYKDRYTKGIGSMITIDMGTKEKAFAFLDNSKIITLTANIGDSRTLALHMQSTIYSDFTQEEKDFLGITPGLIRVSIGLEDPEKISADFLEAYRLSNQTI